MQEGPPRALASAQDQAWDALMRYRSLRVELRASVQSPQRRREWYTCKTMGRVRTHLCDIIKTTQSGPRQNAEPTFSRALASRLVLRSIAGPWSCLPALASANAGLVQRTFMKKKTSTGPDQGHQEVPGRATKEQAAVRNSHPTTEPYQL